MRTLGIRCVMAGLVAVTCSAAVTARAGAADSGVAGILDSAVVVTSPSGIDLTPRFTTYVWNPILSAGSVTTTAGGTFAGCINFGPATGGFGPGPFGIRWPQGGETILGGTGNVNQFPVASAPCPIGAPNVGNMNGVCSSAPSPISGIQGGFIRVGPVVLVLLNCGLSVNGGPTVPSSIAVGALFIPPAGQNGVTVPITQASVIGAFAGSGNG